MKPDTTVAANDPVIAIASQPANNSRATSDIDLDGLRRASESASPTALEASSAIAAQHGLALIDAHEGDLPQVSLVVV